MNGKTPARDLAKNTSAFEDCLARMLVDGFQPKVAVDIRYGLGGWGTLLAKEVPEISVVGFEADRATYEAAIQFPRLQLRNCEGQSVRSGGFRVSAMANNPG